MGQYTNYNHRIVELDNFTNDPEELHKYIDKLVYDAYIAGADGTKGIGLNLSKTERAEQYCISLGLR